jgi:hypothetical protein
MKHLTNAPSDIALCWEVISPDSQDISTIGIGIRGMSREVEGCTEKGEVQGNSEEPQEGAKQGKELDSILE